MTTLIGRPKHPISASFNGATVWCAAAADDDDKSSFWGEDWEQVFSSSAPSVCEVGSTQPGWVMIRAHTHTHRRLTEEWVVVNDAGKHRVASTRVGSVHFHSAPLCISSQQSNPLQTSLRQAGPRDNGHATHKHTHTHSMVGKSA